MSFVNLLTGLSTGRFDTLRVKNPATGEYEAIVPGQYASQDLLKVYVGGVLYPATALAFNNSFSNFDPTTSTLQIGGPLYQSYLRLGDSTTYTDLTRGSAGELLWNNDPMASEALVTQVQSNLQTNLDGTVAYVQGSFQGKLATLSESTTDAVILQSLDASNLHIAWGIAPNSGYVNQTGFQTITQTSTTDGGLYISMAGVVPDAVFRFSVDLMAGTKTDLLILNTDGANFSSRVTFLQSMTANTWQTYVWDYGPTSTGNTTLILEPNNGQYIRNTGTFYLRNLRVTQAVVVANFSQDVVISGECTAQAYITSSDERIKGDVQSVDPTQCLQIVKSIPPKIYTRTDLGESEEDTQRRIGVIAQDVARAIPTEWKNVVFYQDGTSLAVDYSRLSVLLLGSVQSLSSRLEALEAE